MSPEQACENMNRGKLADDMDAPMTTKPVEQQLREGCAKFRVEAQCRAHYLEKFGEHTEYILEQFIECEIRRDFLQEEVCKNAFYLDSFRECFRIFPADWEHILRILLERQEIVKNATEEVSAFVESAFPGDNHAQAVRLRLGQILKLANGEREEAGRQFCKAGEEDEISRFVRTGTIELEEQQPEQPKGRRLWTFFCKQCGAIPIEQVHGDQGWEERLESGQGQLIAISHFTERDGWKEEHPIEWSPF